MKEDAGHIISERSNASEDQTDSSDLDAFSETREQSGRYGQPKPKVNVNSIDDVYIPIASIGKDSNDGNNLINEISTAEKGCGDSFNNN